MQKNVGFDFSELDTSVKPTDDFFRFVNGSWLDENPVPAEQVRWGSFIELHESNIARLHGILEEIAERADLEPGSNEQKLHDFWHELMDMKKRNELGIAPLQEELDRIDSIKNMKDVQDAISHLHLMGIGAFWRISVEVDDKNPAKNIVVMQQGGMGLPTRDYYFDEQFAEARMKYGQYIYQIFRLLGYSPISSARARNTMMRIETRLAKNSMDSETSRDIDNVYNPFTQKEFLALAPNVNWEHYLAEMGADKEESLIVAQPDFFKDLGEQLSSVSILMLKHYLRLRLVSAYAPQLSDDFVQASFAYSKALSGAQELKVLWKRGVELTTSKLDHMISPMYVAQYFDEDAKKHMEVLVTNIKKSLANRIQRIPWMGEATKEKARQKLENFDIMVGYPDKWRDMSGLAIGRNSHAENVLNTQRFNVAHEFSALGNPVDRRKWTMPAATVNAYIRFELNHIVFPAGILQFPFFDAASDDAYNYGGIGAIIGHEAGHGFDDQGSKYDAGGVLNDWWDEEDNKRFKALASLVVDQFNGYTVLDDLHVNGGLTQGENIGDLGGLNMALEAYLDTLSPEEKSEKIGGFTPTQRFFFGYARIWRMNIRPELQRQFINRDPHSPCEWRVNGPLTNMDTFHEAFGSQEGDKMYTSPDKRIVIW